MHGATLKIMLRVCLAKGRTLGIEVMLVLSPVDIFL